MSNAPSNRTALVLGLGLTAVLCCTLTVAGLKAGITPGVSPLVILFAWGAFARRLRGADGSRFLNIAQVAGSAGVAIATGVIFTAPLEPILLARRAQPGLDELLLAQANLAATSGAGRGEALARVDTLRQGLLEQLPPLDVWSLTWMSLAGALIGFGFVGLSTGRFLNDPSLPAPEAHACRTMIQAAVSQKGKRPRLLPSLGAGILAGLLAPLLALAGAAREALVLFGPFSNAGGSRRFAVDLHLAPIYIGIGGLLTLGTALLVFLGSGTHALLAVWIAGIDDGGTAGGAYPANSTRWIGGAAMTVAVVYSLIKFARGGDSPGPARDATEPAPDPSLLWISPGWRRALITAIAIGTAGVVGWLLREDGPTPFALAGSATLLLAASVMVTLGALLSLQVGSSASPVSGTVFVTTLALSGVALWLGRNTPDDVALLTPLLVAACVAICTANDSSQDYKTLQLCGRPVSEGFLAQGLGLLVGCLIVPQVLSLAHQAYVLGSANLPAPQGTLFATLIDALLLDSNLPIYPIAIGLVLGLVAVGIEILGHRRGLLLPSMALAVGIYLPPYLGFGMLVGALFRLAAERGGVRRAEGILCAAGLITGGALLDLVMGFGVLAVPGFSPESSLRVFELDSALERGLTALAIVSLGLLLYVNSKSRREPARNSAVEPPRT